MPGTIAPVPIHTFFTDAGAPAVGYHLHTFLSGTTTDTPTYQDQALGSANANPVVLDAAGRCKLFLSPSIAYKFELSTSVDTHPPASPLWSLDGISAVPPASTSADVDVIAVAGENLALNEVCYLSDGTGGLTAGRWYLTDADTVAKSTGAIRTGFATAAITTGSSGTVRTEGRVTGLTGLVAGEWLYASATAGALTNSAPTNARIVAQADTTTTAIVVPFPPTASATIGGIITAGTQTIAGAKTFSGNNTYSGTSAVTGQATFGPTVPPIGGFGYARKTANTVVNNSTVFVNATDLAFAVAASAEYWFQFTMMVRASTAADMRFQLTGPAAPTGVVMGLTGGQGIGPVGHEAAAAFSTIMSVSTIDATDYLILLTGYLRNGVNAGTVQAQFAQGAADATDATVYAESFVRYERRA